MCLSRLTYAVGAARVVSVPAHLRRETGTLRFPQTVFGPRLSLLDTACARKLVFLNVIELI